MAKKRTSQRQSNVHDSARRNRVERNQLTDLIINEKLITTQSKAKELSRKMDKLVTFAKKGDIAARREVAKVLRTKESLDKLFTKYGKKYAKRDGGYTRVLKFGNRKGDNAPVAIVVFT